MAQSLAQLYVEFASKGLKTVQKDMQALQQQMQASQNRAAELQGRLKELNAHRQQQQGRLGQLNKKEQKSGLSKDEIKERKAILSSLKHERTERASILKNLLAEQSHMRTLKGLEQGMQANLKKKTASVKEFGDGVAKVEGLTGSIAAGFKKVGIIATAAFSAGLASMLQLASAADPTGWRMFRAELEILQIHVGRIFIPILRQLTRVIQGISNWFKSLSPQQRQQVRLFAMIGMGILGVVGIIGTLGAALLGLIPIVASVVTAINGILTAGTGGLWALVPIIGVIVTALLGLAGVAVGAGGAFYVLGQQGESFGEKLKNAWNQIWAVVGPIIDKFIEGCKRIFAVAKVYFGMVGDTIQEFLDSFGTNWNEVWATAQQMFSVFMDWVVEGFKVIGAAGMGLVEIMRQVGMAIKDAITGVVAVIKTLANNTIRLLRALGDFDPAHPIDSARRIAEAVKQNYADMANTLSNQKNPWANFDMGKVGQKIKDFYVKATIAEQKAKLEHQKGKENPDEVPMARAEAPKLRDVAEVWKAAQTAQQNDPMLKVQQERLELQRQALEEQRKQTEALNEIRRRREGLR